MRIAILTIILIGATASGYCGEPYDKTDRVFFTGLVVSQIADGLTTAAHLSENSENYITSSCAWKYGDNRPSPARLWTVKTAEVGLAYLISK